MLSSLLLVLGSFFLYLTRGTKVPRERCGPARVGRISGASGPAIAAGSLGEAPGSREAGGPGCGSGDRQDEAQALTVRG